jgi:hypothetical protein
MSIRSWFRHAFAVDPPGPVEPTPAEQGPVDWLSKQIVKRHLATPAIFTLEMSRPLNFITAQMMHVMGPAAWAILPPEMYGNYTSFASFLEKRGSIDHICRRIEQLEAEAVGREKAQSHEATKARSSGESDQSSPL